MCLGRQGIKRLLDKRLLLTASNAFVVSAGFPMSLFLVIPFRNSHQPNFSTL